MKATYVTKSGLLSIQKKIYELSQEIKECNRKIGITVDLDNDLRENPEFMALRTKVEYELPNRISELSDIINNYMVIENLPHIVNNKNEYIGIGHQILLLDDNDNERIIHILGYGDSEPQRGIVSYLTPLAQKLLELSIDDEIILMLGGQEKTYYITEIKNSSYLTQGNYYE